MKYIVIFAVLAAVVGVVYWLKGKPKPVVADPVGPVPVPEGPVKKPGEPDLP